MLIDIHRHSDDTGRADMVVRNLFHSQDDQIKSDGWYSIGLHPWHVSKKSLTDDLQKISKAAVHPRVLAIGEAGLDKSIDTAFEIQIKAFEAQVEIAIKVNKPMVIHCVRAYNEVLATKLKFKHKKPWILHWFNEAKQTGEQLIRENFYLSFGHMLFNDRSKAYHSFRDIPQERIFLETDDTNYSIDDISNSHHCKFAYMVRKYLHKQGIYKGITVVYSPEPVRKEAVIETDVIANKRSIVGTISYMPAVFGCYCAAEAIKYIGA